MSGIFPSLPPRNPVTQPNPRPGDEPHKGEAYDLFIGEVVAYSADTCVFSDGRWHFEGDDSLRTIHYVAGGTFHATGDGFEVGA